MGSSPAVRGGERARLSRRDGSGRARVEVAAQRGPAPGGERDLERALFFLMGEVFGEQGGRRDGGQDEPGSGSRRRPSSATRRRGESVARVESAARGLDGRVVPRGDGDEVRARDDGRVAGAVTSVALVAAVTATALAAGRSEVGSELALGRQRATAWSGSWVSSGASDVARRGGRTSNLVGRARARGRGPAVVGIYRVEEGEGGRVSGAASQGSSPGGCGERARECETSDGAGDALDGSVASERACTRLRGRAPRAHEIPKASRGS